jgi:hypothetical protein
MLQRFVKARCYQLCLEGCPILNKAGGYGGDGLLTKVF